MKRRDVLKIIAGAVTIAPNRAAAQTAVRTYRIGTLTVGPPIPPTAGTGKMLVDGLAKRGFNLGQNLAYEPRGATGKVGQMPNLMQELRCRRTLHQAPWLVEGRVASASPGRHAVE